MLTIYLFYIEKGSSFSPGLNHQAHYCSIKTPTLSSFYVMFDIYLSVCINLLTKEYHISLSFSSSLIV